MLRKPAGFTLIEAMTALAITAMAGAMILLSLETSLQNSEQIVVETIAQGMAKQIIDEAIGCRYMSPGGDPYQWPLTPNSWEQAGNGRERFDDTDDFVGITANSAEDIHGQPLGEGDYNGGLRPTAFMAPSGYFTDWRQEIDVYYVDDDDLSVRLATGQTSNHRAVEVVISRQLASGDYLELARIRRVTAYVPH